MRAAGNRGVVAEVEVLDRAGLLEVRGPHPAGDARGVAPGQLVLAERLEELDVAEFAGVGLGQAHL